MRLRLTLLVLMLFLLNACGTGSDTAGLLGGTGGGGKNGGQNRHSPKLEAVFTQSAFMLTIAHLDAINSYDNDPADKYAPTYTRNKSTPEGVIDVIFDDLGLHVETKGSQAVSSTYFPISYQMDFKWEGPTAWLQKTEYHTKGRKQVMGSWDLDVIRWEGTGKFEFENAAYDFNIVVNINMDVELMTVNGILGGLQISYSMSLKDEDLENLAPSFRPLAAQLRAKAAP